MFWKAVGVQRWGAHGYLSVFLTSALNGVVSKIAILITLHMTTHEPPSRVEDRQLDPLDALVSFP